MENKRELQDLIEKYFSGQMETSEQKTFEAKMATDAALAEEYVSYQKLMKSFGLYASRKKIRKKLEEVHTGMQTSVDSSSIRPAKIRSLLSDPKLWSAAASVALIISIGTYLFMNYVNSLNGNDKAHYRELRRDIEAVKSSQNKIIKELNDKPAMNQATFGGTAIAISADGYVLTSYHVVKDVESVYIENKKFSRLKLKKVYTDPRLDLVIMKVEDDSFKTFGNLPFTFRKNNLDLGEKVYTLGYPKQDVVFGEGYISSLNGYEGDTASYQIAVPVNPGQSGGPLFDEQGNLVGIVSGKHTENEGSAFAVKANYLKKAILANDSLNANIHLPKMNYLKNQGKIQMIKKMQDYVFEVKGYN
ncbi:MAG TPA: serine protease [Cytophagaceae bacterium]|nr:serine protease [Cytophagaceae bacterium]